MVFMFLAENQIVNNVRAQNQMINKAIFSTCYIELKKS